MGLLGRATTAGTSTLSLRGEGTGTQQVGPHGGRHHTPHRSCCDATAEVTVHCDTETYVRLVYGRLDLEAPWRRSADDRGRSRAGPGAWPVVQGHLT